MHYAIVLLALHFKRPETKYRNTMFFEKSRLSGRVGGRTGSPMIERSFEFYKSNYEILYLSPFLRPDISRHYIGSRSYPRHCRFCGLSEPHVTFSHEAHAISASIGNRMLFSYEECNNCNKKFSNFEDDFGKYTLVARTFARIRGRTKVPSVTPVKDADGIFKIEADQDRLNITGRAGEIPAEMNERDQILYFNIALQKYRPRGVFKALLKMAMSLLPSEELVNFSEAMLWLNSDGVEENSLSHLAIFNCSIVTGQRRAKHPVAMILRRTTMTNTPYAVFILSFGYWTFQIFLPSPKMDAHIEGTQITTFVLPTMDMLKPLNEEEQAMIEHISLENPDYVDGARWPISLRFGGAVKTTSAAPTVSQ